MITITYISFSIKLLLMLGMLMRFNAVITPKMDCFADMLMTHAINNSIIVLTLNNAYLDFAENWMLSKEEMEITNYVFLATSKKVYRAAIERKWNVCAIHEKSVENNKGADYMSHEYTDILIQRAKFILYGLHLGYRILMQDIDSVYLKNPLPYLKGDYDLIAQDDLPRTGTHVICGGFLFLKNPTLCGPMWENVLREIISKRDRHDQHFITSYAKLHQLKIKLLPSNMFPSGKIFRKMWEKQRDLSHIVVFHNNWIRGKSKKLERFKEYDFWFIDNDHHHKQHNFQKQEKMNRAFEKDFIPVYGKDCISFKFHMFLDDDPVYFLTLDTGVDHFHSIPLASNWFASTKHININNYIFLAFDTIGYDIANNKGWHVCLAGSEKERKKIKQIANKDHSKKWTLIRRIRSKLILYSLKLGYPVVIQDIHAVYLKDPYPYMLGEYDIVSQDCRNIPLAIGNLCGFIFLNSTKSVIELWSTINKSLKDPHELEDHALIARFTKDTNFKIHYLDKKKFIAPMYLMGRNKNNLNAAEVVMIHTTWTPKDAEEVQRIKKAGFWLLNCSTTNSC